MIVDLMRRETFWLVVGSAAGGLAYLMRHHVPGQPLAQTLRGALGGVSEQLLGVVPQPAREGTQQLLAAIQAKHGIGTVPPAPTPPRAQPRVIDAEFTVINKGKA
jgi:hypothetical protein